MKLELAQVRHVAKLARLALTPEEEARFVTQLSAVLEAVEQLASVDTEGIAPTTFPVSVESSNGHTRPDEVKAELPVKEALENAPQKVGTSFAIPRVIE
jgi:aspartyl-tRNA(Asn)/glutamyl-tRNA(Gln) amidotransferase subunit C